MGLKKLVNQLVLILREKKLTLPFIYALNNSSKSKRKWLINSVKNSDENAIREIIKYVIDIGGIDYTQKQIKKFYNSALKDLINFRKVSIQIVLKNL
jgi:octaprenyl-diphosphate synthase